LVDKTPLSLWPGFAPGLVHLHSWSTKLKIVRSRNFLDGKTFAELRYLVVALDELSITLL